MPKNVRAYPNYPFSESNLEETVLEIDKFVADPPLTSDERGEVLEFVRLTRQYAFLEKLIQGEVICELPIHFDLVGDGDADPIRRAEETADRERSLLELGIEPAEVLGDALDERGIKIFRRTHGPESPETLTGAFHYEGEHGPALLVGGINGCPEATFVLAHEYAHLVMDVDPYRSRFCRWDRADMRNLNNSMEEERADRFARALLLPADAVHSMAGELELVGAERPPTIDAIGRAAMTFDVAPAVLWNRLEDLGLARPTVPPEPLDIDECREVDDRRPTDLPERFVNLALAAFGHRILEKKELCRFLRVRPERLDSFLHWCHIPRGPAKADAVGDVMEGEEAE
jgi:Zn-dependent peptidase ImmA (M78 family)